MPPQEEITNRRPSNYSRWHRITLPQSCYMTDGDWFEQRLDSNNILRVVAYIETIQVEEVERAHMDYPIWPSKKQLCQEIKRRNIPVFIVWHNPECSKFLVWKFEEEWWHLMTSQGYIAFLSKL